MIRRMSLVVALIALLGAEGAAAQEQEAKGLTVIGTVKWIGGTSLVVETAKGDMNFDVDQSTIILARGASTRTRQKKEAGEGGLIVADVVRVGDQVLIRYSRAATPFLASEIDVR